MERVKVRVRAAEIKLIDNHEGKRMMRQQSAIGNLIDDQKAIMDFESERGPKFGPQT